MNVAFWVAQTIEEFGRMLGFDDLTFDEQGVLQLDIEDSGVLTLELREHSVLVYLVRPLIRPERATLRYALQLCHHSESDWPWLQAALLSNSRLALAMQIPENEFHIAALEEVITTLTNLHDAVTEGCTL